MDDRYRRELTKLHHGEPPADLWDRALEGPRLAPLGPSPRSRVTAAIVAFAVFGLAAGLLWRSFAESGNQPAGSNQITVPPRGETSAVFLDDGRPVFVVHHQDGTVSVVDAFSSHRAWGVEELNVWCPSTREFVEVAHEAHFDEYGTLTPDSGPAGKGGVATFAFSVVTSDAAGDPASIQIGQIQEPTTPGRNSGEERPPFCPSGDTDPGQATDLISVTGAYSGESGMVLAHQFDDDQIWDSPAEAVAAAPTGWVAIRSTLHVDPDGFVQLCAQVVDDECQGGVVVRGVDGIGLRLNVTGFDWVSGYEEPQVWLVQIHDGVIDNPAGVTNTAEPIPGLRVPVRLSDRRCSARSRVARLRERPCSIPEEWGDGSGPFLVGRSTSGLRARPPPSPPPSQSVTQNVLCLVMAPIEPCASTVSRMWKPWFGCAVTPESAIGPDRSS